MANAAALLGAGAALLLLMSRGDDEVEPAKARPHDDTKSGDGPCTCRELLAAWTSSPGKPLTGRLYQVESGDSGLEIARMALFGTREPRISPRERQAVVDLSIRIDCSPWNQTVYGRTASSLKPGHYAVENGLTTRGVYYMPVFPDNRSRLERGEPPLVEKGNSFPFIWIPKIDLHKFMMTGEVTTLGQDYPDDGQGSYNMIDPPPWVIDLQFEGDLEPGTAGCALPEGDFRKEISLDEDDELESE